MCPPSPFSYPENIFLDGLEFTPNDFAETLDGGQAFRWNGGCENVFDGVFGKNFARIKLLENGRVALLEGSSESAAELKNSLENYLDAENNYDEIRSEILKKSKGDTYLKKSLTYYPKLRILRQSPQDAIISFICSSNKRISQIKQCVELLAKNLGEPIACGKFSLPSFERIAECDDEILLSCKLGFRAKYLKNTARKIVDDKFEPESLRQMPYAKAKEYLTTLSGIGDKVSDCILLFGAARFEAFPVDVWIRRAMEELYSARGTGAEMRSFALKKFGSNAGYAQQLIFAAKRKNIF